MNQIIIHVDMDAFYASVEMRDNPALRGKPLIIGSLPHERGVVATCSYAARKFGVHSAMNIKEAYRLCPDGVYMHPNFEKYRAVSAQLHDIWNTYATASEYIALDEAYLDVTKTAGTWEKACDFARTIKERTRNELELTCSIGIAYCKSAAKIASEEKKPDWYFEIPTAEAFVRLIEDRDIRVLYTVGEKTAEKLHSFGIHTVRDMQQRREDVLRLLGKQGQWLTQLAFGEDDRKVSPYKPEDAKSISRELTFQADTEDYGFLRDVLFLLSMSVERRAKRVNLYGEGVTLKLTYSDMKSITRSEAVSATRSAMAIYSHTLELPEQAPKKPIRLIGVGLHHLTDTPLVQMRLEELLPNHEPDKETALSAVLEHLHRQYGLNFAENLDRIFQGETLYRTVEYMRKHAGSRQ